MANVLSRTAGLTFPYRKEYKASVNTGDYPVSDWIINPDLSAVQGWETVYWDIVGDNVVLADQATRDARAAELVANQELVGRNNAKERYDEEDLFRALALTIMDELNILRAQHSLAPRTAAQLRTAIRNRINGGV